MKYLKFSALLLRDKWISPAYVGVSSNGSLGFLSQDPPETACAIEGVSGIVLPGFQNAHSHAFQYAMAGMAENHPAGASDDFWSWREAMYRCALNISPDQLEAVAAVVYAEMLRNGYTHVAEFHYLHHDQKGNPYNNLAEMGERLIAAAKTAGIKITLIPIFYQQGNFGKAPEPRQRRFISNTLEDYFQLLDDSSNAVRNYSGARLGFGVHSLRAVRHEDIVRAFDQGPKNIPFHLHAAEQTKEVSDCLAFLGKRPISWLLENMAVNDRFHIVHCTHMEDDEVSSLAQTGANVVLCPGTEGNLGDGIFRLTDYANQGGSWCIGTDSHISLNPLEDLRWLDYAQRLMTHKRNTFDDGAQRLISNAVISGRRALGNVTSIDFFELGEPFDAVVYDSDSPLLQRGNLDSALSTILYLLDSSYVIGTLVDGKWVVRNQRHANASVYGPPFRAAMEQLGSSS